MLGIDQVNYIIVSSRLTSALVPPIATKIGKHAGEVTHRSNARSRKAGASVGVGPGVTTVS